jgi:para-aminobenzoate synthetase component I
MVNFPVAYFNSNDGKSLLGFGKQSSLILDENKKLESIDEFISDNSNNFIFTAISFDLKNRFENLKSNNKDDIQFPEAIFFTTKYVVELDNGKIKFIQGEKNAESISFINDFLRSEHEEDDTYNFNFHSTTSKNEYLEHLSSLKKHISIGDIYEVNYCQEFIAKNVEIENKFQLYWKLNKITKAPYSTFLNFNNHSLYCGSPELYLSKRENKLTSKPIKGTSKRGGNKQQDEELKKKLKNDPKEKAENIMVVDLARNDLSRIALKNSIRVEELCEIYSFETVHQMISTISCSIDKSTSFTNILEATFPMASMTGVPKISALELIEKYEDFKRGIYSGTIGLIHPNGDFDLNVVIRSLVYNKKNKTLSCGVGGAITDLSTPEQEYEECIVKVKRILDGVNE